MRFCIEQHYGSRVIDNGASNERSTGVGVALVRYMEWYLGRMGYNRRAIKVATRDMKRAYRQLSRLTSQAHAQTICVWHVVWKRRAFAKIRGLCFGLIAAVWGFNRCPAHFCALCKRWLGIPALAFFDDVKLTSFASTSRDIWAYSNKAMHLLGCPVDAEKEGMSLIPRRWRAEAVPCLIVPLLLAEGMIEPLLLAHGMVEPSLLAKTGLCSWSMII